MGIGEGVWGATSCTHPTYTNTLGERYRVYSVIRKMNPSQQLVHQHQQQMAAQQRSSVASSKNNEIRRYVQQPVPNRPPGQNSNRNGMGGGAKNGKSMTSVTIEEVPNHAYLESLNQQGAAGQLKVEEDKLPVFLIKLWNIVEDANLQSIVHWDESGASFHIADPYSFCRNVLPHFFKHNNLNSLIRQLNMYGFRKMTPLSQGGLTRTESDQDHLEFSHPCFVQGRPELLSQIKRKKSSKETEDKVVNEQTQQSLDIVMAEMRSMREKAKNMEDKMNKLTKENRDMWNEMGSMRRQHERQQQYFKKLLHFLVSVMQPGLSKRVAKRGVLGIDFGQASNNMSNGGTPNSKRQRTNVDEGPYKDVCDLLESLQRETQEPLNRRFNHDHEGPLISEVTEDFGNSPGRDYYRPDPFQGPRYSEATSSREQSPNPIVSPPSTNASARNGGQESETKPESMYMGSGALTHENIHRASNGAGKRDHDGRMVNSGAFPQQQATSGGVGGQKRNPYKHAVHKNLNSQNNFQANDYYMPNTLPAQLTYQQPQQPMRQNLMAIEDNQPASVVDPHQNLHSPTLHLSPSFDRQLSQELQEYLNGTDHHMESLRDTLSNYNWNTFGDEIMLDEDEENGALHFDDVQNGAGEAAGPSGLQGPTEGQYQQQYPLALKAAPEPSYYDADGDLMDPLINGDYQIPDQNFNQIPDEEIFPRSPVLRTPSPDNFI
ncbi:hypothetical protein B9Z55_003080 [Caenorhabditis nigoni]|uniref:HSF-type DNA-binding domain-containing protein n=1 Tax=Caenorhabditis nigoni TaxID=1611254 RepID=A0A2G5VNX5_9PELO|nr:hypothetical protein B9Z55_003080 [Caenorhabditis nigoni]